VSRGDFAVCGTPLRLCGSTAGRLGDHMGRLSERKRVSHGGFVAEVITRWIGFGFRFGFGENPSRAAASNSQNKDRGPGVTPSNFCLKTISYILIIVKYIGRRDINCMEGVTETIFRKSKA
jgi:hypothetical protein